MEALIEITRMVLRGHHGVAEQERLCGNDFEVTVRLRVDYDGTDRLESTVNYADVAALVRRHMSIPSTLIEHVAARIAAALRTEFPLAQGGEVTVAKLRPPMDAEVARVSATVGW